MLRRVSAADMPWVVCGLSVWFVFGGVVVKNTAKVEEATGHARQNELGEGSSSSRRGVVWSVVRVMLLRTVVVIYCALTRYCGF
jgi:hypothetical protein